MIQAIFTRTAQGLGAFEVTGHAGFAPAGEDIVCASVTSAVQLTANGITEILGVPATVTVEENRICLALPAFPQEGAREFLQALYLHLTLLEQEYPQHITVSEV
ncbi:MAG: ribosomal-processing cysteine protease Prp [Oscillospiraceae bacterium]